MPRRNPRQSGGQREDFAGIEDVLRVERTLERSHPVDRGSAGLVIWGAIHGVAYLASLADRYRTHVEEPTRDWSALPRFLTLARKTPRLSKVRYDAFYKYLRAHFPEIRDVGNDFPSAARFDELGLRWLDAHVVGDGRMALFAGAGEAGVHLFSLDSHGFVKAAFIATDKFPEPVVRVEGDRVTVLARDGGAEAVREMLWWGP